MNEKQSIVKGFRAASVAAGIKKGGGPDLALIVSDQEASAAGVFTTNKVKAAPVILSQEHLRRGRARAIVANAGNANACTGRAGYLAAKQTAEMVARELGIETQEILVSSTGVIGAALDVDLISRAVPELVKNLSPGGLREAVQAIMTTDSFPKMAQAEGVACGKTYKIMGLAKGAGMIMPDMATMLCFVLTDLAIEGGLLRKALSSAVNKTLNRITVDGDTSTNDTALILANGTAGNGDLSPSDFEGFEKQLTGVLGELAAMIVKDGEGATKVVTIQIKGALSKEDADKAARTVANSTLVKTAFYGQDPNWGRIMAALGRSAIEIKEELTSIWMDDVKIVHHGVGVGMLGEKEAAEIMKNTQFRVTVDLGLGNYEETLLTCDLTHEYVSINAHYRT
ncbi:MAG: bifunctional glutamate N-acetyltransferase/amino-acid acetyltransferase ArgJ [Deltaproteobacteria bacterium]|nr:bifunctional glutamate N-acetyltransferase/amino-acid acetyltransferase ArgJ [Deltaproteobacteria bacterium]